MISSTRLAAGAVVLALSATAAAQTIQQQPSQAPAYGQANPGQPAAHGQMMHGQMMHGPMTHGQMMNDPQMQRDMAAMMQGCHRMMSRMSEMRPQSPGR